MAALIPHHQHGKNRVRVLKVVRRGGMHYVSDMNVNIQLFSPEYAKAFTAGDNTDLVATDTMRISCYIVAKKANLETPEQYGVALCEHFLSKYPMLTGVDARVVEKRWKRHESSGTAHSHGFVQDTPIEYTAHVSLDRGCSPQVVAGIRNFVVLKTTQSGFEGFLRNEHTGLPETRERLLSTSVTATWKAIGGGIAPSTARLREDVIRLLSDTFFGPPRTGTYSASVQETLYKMCQAVLDSCPAVETIKLDLPNIHNLPFPLDRFGSKFEDDIFTPTDEPHGTIQATITRSSSKSTAPLMPPAPMRAKL